MVKELSIVLGTRNRLSLLKQCLASLKSQISYRIDVIVIDAGSTDGTIEYLQSLPWLRLICDGKPIGQAKSFNRLLKTLDTKYFCWISDDNEVCGDLIEALNILKSDASIGMVSLKTKDVIGPMKVLPYIGGIRKNGVLTCNQGMLALEVMKEVEYFDEDLGTYGIDPDLTAKILLKGYRVVYTKKVFILHHRDHGKSPGVLELPTREKALEDSLTKLDEKYAFLRPDSFKNRLREKGQRISWRAVKAISAVSAKNETRQHDWYNIIFSSTISPLDLWKNRNNNYYLEQRIKNRA